MPEFGITIAAEGKPEQITVEAEHGTRWVVTVRPLLTTRAIVIERMHGDGALERKALAALVSVESATVIATGLDVGTTDGRPATDPTTWPLMLGAFYELARQINNRALDLGEQVESERGNSSPAPG